MSTHDIKLPIHNEDKMDYDLTNDGSIKLIIQSPVTIKFYKDPVRLSTLEIGDIFYVSIDGIVVVQDIKTNNEDNLIYIYYRKLSNSNDSDKDNVYDKERKHDSVLIDALEDDDVENHHYVLVCKSIGLGIE